MITNDEARKILGKLSDELSEEKLNSLMEVLYRIADIAVESSMKKMVEEGSKIKYNKNATTQINKQT